MSTIEANIFFIRDLERTLGERRHVIDYALRTYGIAPAGRVGIQRFWHHDQLDTIRSAIKRCAARRVEVANV